MNLRMAQHPDCWGAMDFVDDKFEPRKRTLTIRGNGCEKPPATKKEKAFLLFDEDGRKAFLSNKEMMKIANALRSLEMDNWKGAKVQITAGPKKNPLGGAEVLGMVVLQAAFAKPAATQKTTENKPEPEKRDAEE